MPGTRRGYMINELKVRALLYCVVHIKLLLLDITNLHANTNITRKPFSRRSNARLPIGRGGWGGGGVWSPKRTSLTGAGELAKMKHGSSECLKI